MKQVHKLMRLDEKMGGQDGKGESGKKSSAGKGRPSEISAMVRLLSGCGERQRQYNRNNKKGNGHKEAGPLIEKISRSAD